MRMFMYGIYRNPIIQKSDWERIGARRVRGYTLYTQVGGGVAFARPAVGGEVYGTLWEIPDNDVLGYIDRVEQHPNWYRRTRVVTDQGEECWMYVQQEECENQPNIYMEIGPLWTPAAIGAAMVSRRVITLPHEKRGAWRRLKERLFS